MNDMDENSGEQGKEFRITYILSNTIHTPIRYFRNDPSWIAIYTKTISLLTNKILSTFLYEELGISVPESVIEAILAYPRDNNVEKDVTVVFTY